MIKLSPTIEAQLSRDKSSIEQLPNVSQYDFPGLQLRYHMPDTFTTLTFRTEVADHFQKITDIFDSEWPVLCDNLNDLDCSMAEDVKPLNDKPYKRKRQLHTDAAECTETCAVSDNCLGYSLAFHYKNDKAEDFSIQFVYDAASHTLYLTWMIPGRSSAVYSGVIELLIPMLMNNEDYHLIPENIDGIDSPIFLPGDLSEKDAKAQIDQMLSADEPNELPYVFFTKMLGFVYPVSRISANDSREIIAARMFSARGICHAVMIETRSLAAYLTSKLSAMNLRGVRIPSATSGFALLAWPKYSTFTVMKPEDCILDSDSGKSMPIEFDVTRCTTLLISVANDPNKQLTMDRVAKLAEEEKEKREAAVKQSDTYKALEAENTALKEQIAKIKSAPAVPAKDDSYVQALEDKCEALRVENGQLKLRNDALLDTNTTLRKKKAKDEHSIILSAEGIPEMYDNELYIQIMALLNDALPGLRTAGAVRRAEIVESVLKANSYHGEIESIHDELVRTSKSGRRDDLFAVLAKYGVTVDNKSHPALYFANGSAAHETVSGTPSDRNALVNAAKHIAKSMF